MGAAVATLCCGGPASAQTAPVPIDPAGWITNDDYPPEALRIGAEGIVTILLNIDANGKVVGCAATGGGPVLDDPTCRVVLPRARFEPARDIAGSPVSSTFPLRFRWQKPFDEGTYLIADARRIQVTIASTGAVEKCELWHLEHITSLPQSCDVVTGMAQWATSLAWGHGPGVLNHIERISIEGVPDASFPPELEIQPDWTQTLYMTVNDRGRVTACRMVATNTKTTRCPGKSRFLASPGRRPMTILHRISEAFRPST